MKRNKGVVVLGHPRSGTTLLRRLLGAHPHLAAPPETHLLSAAARFVEADMTAHGVDMGVLAGLSFAGFEDEEVLAALRRFTFGFLDQFAARQDKPRWVEKTAFDIFHLENIEKICADEVYYIGVIRHPLDVAISTREFCDASGTFPAPLHRYIVQHPQPMEAFTRSWVDATHALVDLGTRRPENTIICRYEDLVAAPGDTVSALLEFIGEDAGSSAGEMGEDPHLGFSDHKTYRSDRVNSDSVERWRSLTSYQIARLAPLVNDLLEQCGYDPLPAGTPLSTDDARRHYLAVQAAARKQSGQTSR